jgi:TRAP-type C4-dicarboxylate transport system substrate-binding protein
MIRKWGALLSVVLLAAVLVSLVPGCAPAAGETQEWRLGQVMPEDSPYAKICADFADEVREKTDGRIDITVYNGGVLGDWVLMNELVMRGDVEMLLNPIAPTYDPRLNIAYYTPYLFTTIDEAKAAYATGGWINEMVGDLLEGVNIKGLAAFPAGLAGCTLREVPPSPADPDVPKNQKIRVMPLKACELTFERLGYIPLAIPYAEAYIAIDTGIADGEMGGPPFQGTEFMDIQGCWIQYNDYVETWWFALNLDKYNALSEADQKVVVEAAQKQADDYWLKVEADDEKYRQEMADAGLEIIEFTEAELENIAEAIRTDVWPELEPLVGKAVMDICREHVGMPVD